MKQLIANVLYWIPHIDAGAADHHHAAAAKEGGEQMNAFIYRESSLARSVVGFLGSRRYLDLPLYVPWGCQGRNARLTLDANRTELFRRQENPACIVAPRNIIAAEQYRHRQSPCRII